MSSRITVAALTASLIVLGGCAETGTGGNTGLTQSPAEPQAVATSSTASASSTPVAQANASPAASTPQAAAVSPVIEFEESTTQLDNAALQQVHQLLPAAQQASNIVIYGHSDRNNPGNAKNIAIERALRVRTIMINNGIPQENIRIRYSTMHARHAVEVVLDDAIPTLIDNPSPDAKN